MNELEDRSPKVSSHKERLSLKCKNTVFWLFSCLEQVLIFFLQVVRVGYVDVGFRVRFSFLLSVVDYKKLN